jgi:putative IMPACT (imprinted ancient) family translation regulator
LAAGAYAYLASASLVNKYYSLRAQTGPKGGGVLQNVGGLVFQIKNGRRRALEAAGACQKELGFIPASAKIAWENARALEGNNYDDMLDALEAYWSATFWSELALALARP